jgi:hypothetical protein
LADIAAGIEQTVAEIESMGLCMGGSWDDFILFFCLGWQKQTNSADAVAEFVIYVNYKG